MKLKISNPNIIYLLLILLYVLFQLVLLVQVPDIMEDEPWYANTAFNFSNGDGFTNTAVGRYGGDYIVVYTFLLGLGIKIFGCTLFVTRMVSILGGVFAILALIQILKLLKISQRVTILTLLMFLFSNVTYIVFRTARPEGWVLAFGLWAVYYFLKFNSEDRTKFILLGGLFASLSFLSHPNGVLFLFNGGIYLILYSIRKKNILNLVYFGLISIALIAIHFAISLSNPSVLANFLEQASTRNSVTNEEGIGFFQNFSNFYSVYTLGVKRIFILFFEIGVLVVGMVYVKRNNILAFIASMGLLNLLVSFIFISPYSSRHFGEIIIYSLIVFALILENTKVKRTMLLFLALGVIYLMNNFAGDLYVIYSKHNNTPYSAIEERISQLVPEKSIVVTSLHFWYPLQNSQIYNEYTFYESKPYEDLTALLNSGDVDYLIYTDAWTQGVTGTSGRDEAMAESSLEFFNEMKDFIDRRGKLVDEFVTVGFETIRLYSVNDF